MVKKMAATSMPSLSVLLNNQWYAKEFGHGDLVLW